MCVSKKYKTNFRNGCEGPLCMVGSQPRKIRWLTVVESYIENSDTRVVDPKQVDNMNI
jgi:hypothetical protein